MPGYDWQTDKMIVDAGRWATEHGTDVRRAEKRYGIDKSVHVSPNFLPEYALGRLGQDEGQVLDIRKLGWPWWAWGLVALGVGGLGFLIGQATSRG